MDTSSTLSSANEFVGMSKEQRIAKIMFDIARYDENNSQIKLSLLQDLVLDSLLLNLTADASLYHKLTSIRCHSASEDVAKWIDKMAKVYIEDPRVKCVLSGLTNEQLSNPY